MAPLTSEGPHSVGIRHVTRELAVYYPTLIKPIEGEPWLPGNDARYIHAIAKKAGVRSMWLKHLRLVRIPCTRNASIVSLMTHKGEPRQVFLMSHTTRTHHLAYSRLALALAARGAIVYSVLHSDSVDISGLENVSGTAAAAAGEDPAHARLLVQERCSVQLAKRLEDVSLVIGGISRGELLQKLQVRSADLKVFFAGGPKVHLIGHGFGAVTMLAAALKAETASSFIGSVTALDAWPLTMLEEVTRGPLSIPSHINVQLVDSEEWYQRREHCVQLEALKELLTSAGVLCIHRMHGETDHMSVTDMGLLTPLTKRKRFASKKSSAFIPFVAKEIMEFAEGWDNDVVAALV
ncbi:phospholipase A2-like protein [Trypanosoma grayi]|uniref:phospholipase A2-like protein n=1 Tax=Trypanosoma grayi TaxID=71804 RepID=UPI0004F4539F|nr:phospholipase A2-like protein [Trypanosoma grayi]KEG15184.1 phospholipase A2-like protein [Trypanosoma grayi]